MHVRSASSKFGPSEGCAVSGDASPDQLARMPHDNTETHQADLAFGRLVSPDALISRWGRCKALADQRLSLPDHGRYRPASVKF
jgi:hypothetical protein